MISNSVTLLRAGFNDPTREVLPVDEIRRIQELRLGENGERTGCRVYTYSSGHFDVQGTIDDVVAAIGAAMKRSRRRVITRKKSKT